MKLRDKSIIIFGIVLVCLLAILYTVSRQVLLSGFARVERENTARNVERVLDAFTETINNISVKSADWSKWDDTYRFVRDHNPDYIESNLPDESLEELKLNLMLFFDTAGRLVFGRGYDMERNKGVPVADSILAVFVNDTLLLHHQSIQSVVAGVMALPGGPMNIVSRPILTSSGGGPIGGTLVFGCNLDSTEVNRIGQITHLSLNVYPCGSPSLPHDVVRAESAIDKGIALFVSPLNRERIAGYARIADLHDSPVLTVRIDVPRDIYKQGIRTMWYLMISIIAAVDVFGAVIIVLLQKTVLSRVARLSADVNFIGAKGDNTARVGIGGKDELADLGRSVNGMLSALELVEKQVKSRNREMRMIMDTVPSGLLSIDENYRINPEYAKSVETILGKKDLAERDFFTTLGLTDERLDDKNSLLEFLDLMLQELLPEREMADLNPFEELAIVHESGRNTWVRLRYFIIHRDEGRDKRLLVVITDITEEKTLSERVHQSERENMQLKAIAEDPDLFRDFLADMKGMLARLQERFGRLPASAERRPIVNEMFREAHTIKGTAGTFGLAAVVDAAGQLEETLSSVRVADDFSTEFSDTVRSSLAELSRAVTEVVEKARKILGEESGDPADIHLRISLEKIKSESETIRNLVAMDMRDKDAAVKLQRKIDAHLKKLQEVPAHRGLAKALRIIPGLIRKFDKNVAFELEGADVPVDCEIARELNTPLIHLLRNAMDHGVEDPGKRVSSGKEECGHVRVVVREDGGDMVVQVADDGKGLDPRHFKEVAIEKGMLSEADAVRMADKEACALIFKPGFTTTETVSEVSGRGVGMDAVLTAVEERLKGKLTIDSEIGRGTTFTIRIPLLPGSGRGFTSL